MTMANRFALLSLLVMLSWAASALSQFTCPYARSPVQCYVDPCIHSRCRLGCVADYCGGCFARCKCNQDSDCKRGQEWCRTNENGINVCVPFAEEGDRCGGFTLPQFQQRCGPGLDCTDFPEPTFDVPGFCRAKCSSRCKCPSGQYCGSNRYCRPFGQCYLHKDCEKRKNHWDHIQCVGNSTCEFGQCAWECTGRTACTSDSDCDVDYEWCREEREGSFCHKFQSEGGSCGGHVLPEYREQCAPGFECTDYPEGTADLPGVCREECDSTKDCPAEHYCGSGGVCREFGQCFTKPDCTNTDNHYATAKCVGTLMCDEGRCSIHCGV